MPWERVETSIDQSRSELFVSTSQQQPSVGHRLVNVLIFLVRVAVLGGLSYVGYYLYTQNTPPDPLLESAETRSGKLRLTIYNRGGPGTVCINYKTKGGSKEIGPPSSSATVTDEWAALANSLASLDPKHKAFFEKGERRTIEYSLGEPASDVEVSD